MNSRSRLYHPDARYFSDCLLLCVKDSGIYVGGKDVAYICRHNAQGAFGFFLTRRYSLKDSALFIDAMREEVGVDRRLASRWGARRPGFPRYVHWGGPKEPENGLLFHPRDIYWDSESTVTYERGVSTSSSLIAAEFFIMNDPTARKSKLILGHLSFGVGELNQEIVQGVWRAYRATDMLLFDLDAKKLSEQLKKLKSIS